MASGPPQLAAVGDRGSSYHNPTPPTPPKILLAKPPLPHASSAAAEGDGGAGPGARARQPPQPDSFTLVSDSWEAHTDKFLPVPCCFSLLDVTCSASVLIDA
jgi:protein SMG9